MTTAEVCDALGLVELKGRKWHVQGAVATKGLGLYEGLDWLSSALKTIIKRQKTSVGTRQAASEVGEFDLCPSTFCLKYIYIYF